MRDVAAINWRERAILLSECKWRMERVGCSVIRELVEHKTPKVLRVLADKGTDWIVHYAFFARTGLAVAARQEAHEHQALLVDLVVLNGRGFAVQSPSVCRAIRVIRVLPDSEKGATMAAVEQANPVLTRGTRWSSAGL